MGVNMNWDNKQNKRYTVIAVYVIITAVIIYCLSLVAKSAPTIMATIMVGVGWIMQVAKPIVYAFVIAYLFDPIINFLEIQFKKIHFGKKQVKSCRAWAVFTTILLFVLILAVIISLLVFSITDQIRLANLDDIIVLANSYKETVNDFYSTVLNKLAELNIQSTQISQYVTNATTDVLNILKGIAVSAVSSVTNISSYLTTFLFSFIIGIYFMIDGNMIKAYIKKVGKALMSRNWNEKAGRFIVDADTVFSGYIRGQLSDALVMMILISLTLSVVGVKFAVLIGIFAGIGNLIPYCGPFVAYFSTILICLVNGQYKELVIALIALFIVQAVDGNIIAPKLLSKSIQIHPVLIIIFLIFGSAIGGLLGMLLAVPVGGLAKLLFVRFIDHQYEKKESEKSEDKKA
jgi:predicted PurR-regulated permease PerM